MTNKLNIGIFADKGMGKWLSQSFEPLVNKANITLFIPENNKHDPSAFKLPKIILRHKHESWLALKKLGDYFRRWLNDNERMARIEFYPYSLREHFSTHRYDLMFTKADRSLYTLSMLKDEFGFKLVYRYPFTLPFTQVFDKRSEFTRRKSFDKIDHFICISETDKKNLEYEGINPSMIDVVHNSVDLSFFKPGEKDDGLKKRLGISGADKVILFVGKLVSWKNPFTLLYAIKILHHKGIQVKLLMAGRGVQRENLRNMVSLLGVADSVILLDFIENTSIDKYYRLADIFVMPSLTTITWEDQFPFAVVEAMASGLPVVVTDSGGMPELVGDVGKIYPQGNYRELAQCICEILADGDLHRMLSDKSRQRAEDMFDNSINSLKILSVLKKVVST